VYALPCYTVITVPLNAAELIELSQFYMNGATIPAYTRRPHHVDQMPYTAFAQDDAAVEMEDGTVLGHNCWLVGMRAVDFLLVLIELFFIRSHG